MPYDPKTKRMVANTTAPAKARSETALSSGAFPIGDKRHAELALSSASRAANAGNLSITDEATVKRRAREALKKYSQS